MLLCVECDSIFSLGYKLKVCTCGKVSGKYVDEVNAIYSGDSAYPIAFANSSFRDALRNQPKSGAGKRFDAFVVAKDCGTYIKI